MNAVTDAKPATRSLQIVRACTPDHHLGAFKLACAMHRETDFRAFEFSPEKAHSGLGAWVNLPDRNVLLLAMRGDDAIGMLAASIRDPWFSFEPFVTEDFLYVRQDERGSRAAFMLMRALVAWVRERGVRHMRAGVATGTGEQAGRLYEHFGMRFVGGNYSAHF